MLVHIEVESIIETVPCWNQSGIGWGDWEKYEILLPSFFRLPGFTVGGSPREMERDGRQEKKTEECGWKGGKKWEIAQQFLIFQRAKRSEPRKEGRRGNREFKVRKGDRRFGNTCWTITYSAHLEVKVFYFSVFFTLLVSE